MQQKYFFLSELISSCWGYFMLYINEDTIKGYRTLRKSFRELDTQLYLRNNIDVSDKLRSFLKGWFSKWSACIKPEIKRLLACGKTLQFSIKHNSPVENLWVGKIISVDSLNDVFSRVFWRANTFKFKIMWPIIQLYEACMMCYIC